jgi:hypothetical protein
MISSFVNSFAMEQRNLLHFNDLIAYYQKHPTHHELKDAFDLYNNESTKFEGLQKIQALATAENPHPLAQYVMGTIRLKENKTLSAIAYFSKCNHPLAKMALFQRYQDLNQKDKAFQILQENCVCEIPYIVNYTQTLKFYFHQPALDALYNLAQEGNLAARTKLQELQEKKREQIVFSGDLFLIPDTTAKLLNEHPYFKNLNPDDLFFKVAIKNISSSDPKEFYKPDFFQTPEYIPFSLLKNLEENDQFCLKFAGIKWVLTASQKKSGYIGNRDFGQVKKLLIEKVFNFGPDYKKEDEEFLMKNTVIEKGHVKHPFFYPIQDTLIKGFVLTKKVEEKYRLYLESKDDNRQ